MSAGELYDIAENLHNYLGRAAAELKKADGEIYCELSVEDLEQSCSRLRREMERLGEILEAEYAEEMREMNREYERSRL